MQDLLFHRVAALLALTTITLGCGSEDASSDVPPKHTPHEDTPSLPLRLEGFHTPESVLYDAERDVYWVSNMGEGGAFIHDGDGFLSRIAPDGAVDLRFVSRDRPGVTLDSPKGMAIVGGELYVSDIDRLRVFDPDSGAPLREIVLAGAEFLNDVAVGADGTLYVSDSALDAAFMPTGHDAIYRIPPGAAPERWLTGNQLGNPNGLEVTAQAVWVVTFGSGELIEVGFDREVRSRHVAPAGGLDGIASIDDAEFLITSWTGMTTFVATRAGDFKVEREGVESPADVGFDPVRRRMLLPLMNAGEVLIDSLGGTD